MNKLFSKPNIKLAGDSAVVVDLGESIHPEINSKVHNFAQLIEQKNHTWLSQIIPAYKGLLIYYDPLIIEFFNLKNYLLEEFNNMEDSHGKSPTRIITIPTLYGGKFGPDLDNVMNHTKLTKSDVIKIHTSTNYLVYAIGFSPGFPYLGGLSKKLNTPRLKNPRTKIPAGSVAIAETQTGVYPSPTPGGWQIIGKTPVKLFDPTRNPPVLVNPGDYIKFESLKNMKEYQEIETLVSKNKFKVKIDGIEE